MAKEIPGIGECVVCGTLTDNRNDFTCGNPHCNEELKKTYKKAKQFLEEYECGDFQGVEDYINNLKVKISRLKQAMRATILTAQRELKKED